MSIFSEVMTAGKTVPAGALRNGLMSFAEAATKGQSGIRTQGMTGWTRPGMWMGRFARAEWKAGLAEMPASSGGRGAESLVQRVRASAKPASMIDTLRRHITGNTLTPRAEPISFDHARLAMMTSSRSGFSTPNYRSIQEARRSRSNIITTAMSSSGLASQMTYTPIRRATMMRGGLLGGMSFGGGRNLSRGFNASRGSKIGR